MRIYTRTGDTGETGLLGGSRVSKSDARIEAVGTMDELNATLGWVLATGPQHPLVVARLGVLQNLLFDLGAEVAADESVSGQFAVSQAEDSQVLEREMDAMNEHLGPLKNFILPGGTPAAAALHVARTVCRRAERVLVSLDRSHPQRPETIRVLNRLSDWLFVAARLENAVSQVSDVLWKRREPL